jgi:predicted phage-related endonuclease
MTQTEFEAAAAEYREKKTAAEEAAAAVEEVADKLKAEMETRGVEKAKAGIFEVRYQFIKGSRFDSKAFRTDEPTLFEKYSIETETKRFMVA